MLRTTAAAYVSRPLLSLSAILSFRITDAANLVVASHSVWPLSMVGTSVLGLVLTPVAISRAVLSSTNRTHSNRTWRAFSSIPEPQDGHPSLVSHPGVSALFLNARQNYWIFGGQPQEVLPGYVVSL